MGQLIKTRNLEITQSGQKNKFRAVLVLWPEIGKGICVCARVCAHARVLEKGAAKRKEASI